MKKQKIAFGLFSVKLHLCRNYLEFDWIKSHGTESENESKDSKKQQQHQRESDETFHDQQSEYPSSGAITEGGYNGIVKTLFISQIRVVSEVVIKVNTPVGGVVDLGDVVPNGTSCMPHSRGKWIRFATGKTTVSNTPEIIAVQWIDDIPQQHDDCNHEHNVQPSDTGGCCDDGEQGDDDDEDSIFVDGSEEEEARAEETEHGEEDDDLLKERETTTSCDVCECECDGEAQEGGEKEGSWENVNPEHIQ